MNTSPDPRGPSRTIQAIEERRDITLLTLDCGHVGRFAQHFTYKTGRTVHCFDCGPRSERIKAMPEEA